MSKLNLFEEESSKKPQKCRRQKKQKILGVQEPRRISIYDQMQLNFKIANRKTFLHRLMYIGTYRSTLEEEIVIGFFKQSVSAINKWKPLETLCGFLLIYPQHFVHLVEGDEDSVYNHLGFVLYHNDFDRFFPNVKVLVDLNHVNDKICIDWSHYSSIPNALVAPINVNSNINSTAQHICRCYGLVCALINAIKHPSEKSLKSQSDIPKIMSRSTSLYRASVISFGVSDNSLGRTGSKFVSTISRTMCPYKNLLPEAGLLDFLLETTNTMKLKDVVNIYGKTPQRNIYKDLVWPIPASLTLYDVFDIDYDRNLELLPKVRTEYDNESNDKEDDELLGII